MEGVGIDGVFDTVGKEGGEVVVFLADALVGGPEDPGFDLPNGGEGAVAGGVEVILTEVVPVIEGAFFVGLGEVDIGEARAFAFGVGLAGGKGVEGELEVGPAEVFTVVVEAGLGGKVFGGIGGVGAGEVGLGGGLGTVGGLVIEEGEAVFAFVNAVDDAFDFEPMEGHFEGAFGGLNTGGAVELEGFDLALDEGLDASVEGFLLEAEGKGKGLAELLREAAGGGFLEFAGEGFGFEVAFEFTSYELGEDIVEEGAEGGGGEFAGGEFGRAHAHDVAQEETEGALEVIAEAAGGKVFREGEVGRWAESPWEAVGAGGWSLVGVGVLGFKEGLDALQEGGVLGLKEQAGGFGGGGVGEGLGDVAMNGSFGMGTAAAEGFKEVGVAGKALGFGAEAEDLAEGFGEEGVAGGGFGNDAFVEPREGEVGGVVPEELEPTEEVVGAVGTLGVGLAFTEGLFESEAMKGGGEFGKIPRGLGAGFKAKVEAFPIGGGVVGFGIVFQVVVEGLGEVGAFEEFAAGALDFFEGGAEVGIAAKMKAGLEIGGEVAFEEAVDFGEEGFGRDVGREPAVAEGVLQEGAQVGEAGLFGELAPELGKVTEAAKVEGLSLGIVSGAVVFLEGALGKGDEGGVDDTEAMCFRCVAHRFSQGGGGLAGVGARLEFHAPVFEGEGALCPEFGAGTAPGVEALGGAVMPDFHCNAFSGFAEGKEGKGLRVGGRDEQDGLDGVGRLEIFGGVAAGDEGVAQVACCEGGEVVLFEAGELTPALAFEFGFGGFLCGGFDGESGLTEFAAELEKALRHGEEPSGGGGRFLGEDGGVFCKVEVFEACEPSGEDGAFPGGSGLREGFGKEGVGGADGGEF